MRRGVGLALVHRLVTRAGGTIEASSPAGATLRGPPAARVRRRSGMIRILVVDDDYRVATSTPSASTACRLHGRRRGAHRRRGPRRSSRDRARPAAARHLPARRGRPRPRAAVAASGAQARLPARHRRPRHRLGAHRDAARRGLLPREAVQLRRTARAARGLPGVGRADRPGARGRPARRRRLYSLRGAPARRAAATRGAPADDGPGCSRSSSLRPRRSGPPRSPRSSAPSRPTAQRYLAGLVEKQLLDRDLDVWRDRTPGAPLPPAPRLITGQNRETGSGLRLAPTVGAGSVDMPPDPALIAGPNARHPAVGAVRAGRAWRP